MSLYENINKRRKAGKSRSKKKSTISPEIYRKMKLKKGGFAPKKKRQSIVEKIGDFIYSLFSKFVKVKEPPKYLSGKKDGL